LIQFFELSFPFSLISEKLSVPETLSQTISYLSMIGFQTLEHHFHQSLKILFEHFQDISIQTFCSIPIENLENIFSSNELILEDEDQLFNLIINLIKLDYNKKVLLKYIHFEYVSSHFIASFTQELQVEQIDIDLFESLKKGLCCDAVHSYSQIPNSRWIKQPHFLTPKEINEFIQSSITKITHLIIFNF
jgi:hypothetical protein